MRGLAVLMVLISHGFTTGNPIAVTDPFVYRLAFTGFAGVDLFFVLSGFLITRILLTTKAAPHYFRDFYARRSLRIFPLYYVTLAVLLLRGPSDAVHGLRESQVWHWSYLVNVFVARETVATLPVTAHFWSLAVEEQFYLVWPLLVWLLSRENFTRFAWCVVLGAFGLRVALHALEFTQWLPTTRTAIYVMTPTRADALAMGGLIALAQQQNLRRWGPRLALGSLIVLFALWLRNGMLHPMSRDLQLIGYTGFGIGASSIIILALTNDRAARALSVGWLRFFGRYSYALYVVHIPVAYLLARSLPRGPGMPTSAVFLVTMIVLSTGIAMVSWRVLERPMLSLKRYFESAGGTR